jgi:hypothetical protein
MRLAQRFLLELYSQVDMSQSFRDPVNAEVGFYFFSASGFNRGHLVLAIPRLPLKNTETYVVGCHKEEPGART